MTFWIYTDAFCNKHITSVIPLLVAVRNWSKGYAAFTYSYKDKDNLINYIKNQQTHHQKESSEDELRRIAKEQGIDNIDETFLSDE
jgi:hypothetical protein